MHRQQFLQLLLGLTGTVASSQAIKGCRQLRPQDNTSETLSELQFGLLTTETEADLLPKWQPFLADLSQAVGVPVKPFFAEQYSNLIEAMRAGVIQLAWFGGKTYIEAATVADAQAFALTVSDTGKQGYYAHLITNNARPWLQKTASLAPVAYVLENGQDLTFAFNDINSTSGYLVPAYYLFAQNDLDPLKHFKNVTFLGNHEATAMAIANQDIDLATNNSDALERFAEKFPDKIQSLRIIWTSPLIPADPIAYNNALPETLKTNIRNFFYDYDNQTVLNPLKWSGFEAATDQDWNPIRELEIGKQILDMQQNESINDLEKQKIIEGLKQKLAELNTVSRR